MTQINRLSQISEAEDNDIIPIWDNSNSRTRGVLASVLKEYVAADEVVNAKIENDHLILITRDGKEIDAGKLPDSSGIEIADDNLDIGQYTTINFSNGLNAKRDPNSGVQVNVTSETPKDTVLDADVYGDMNADDWVALGMIHWVFETPKLKQLKNSPANVYDYSNDQEREFSVVHGMQTINQTNGRPYIKRTFYINESDRVKGYEKEGYLDDGTFKSADWQPIDGVIVSKKLVSGGTQRVPSSFIEAGGGLKATLNGEKTEFVSLSPFSDVVDIFDSTTINNPEDNRTYAYSTSDVGDDHELWLNLNPDEVVDGYSLTVSTSPSSQSSLSLYTEKSKKVFAPVIPGSTVVIKKLPSTNKFSFFKSSGTPFSRISDAYLDLSLDAWKDLPVNNYFVSDGTYSNIDKDVNGKSGQMFAKVINTAIAGDPDPVIIHEYTLQSSDLSINGRTYHRVCKNKAEFSSAKVTRSSSNEDGIPDRGVFDIGSGSSESLSFGKYYVKDFSDTQAMPPSADKVGLMIVRDNIDEDNGRLIQFYQEDGSFYQKIKLAGGWSNWFLHGTSNTPTPPINPEYGFNLQPGSTIGVTDGSNIKLEGDITFEIGGGEHNLIQPNSDGVIIGTNQKPMNIQFRNDGGDVTLQRSGNTHTFAYEDNTIEELLAGEGITLTGDRRFPKITATAGGSGADPSDGFTLKPSAQIRFDETSKMMLQYDSGTHTLLDFQYDGVGNKYFTQFGAIGTEFQIKTLNRPSVSENSGGFWTLAYGEENHIPKTEWERSTSPRELTADELYQYIDFIFEPFGDTHVAHLVMPDRATWESKFWVPSVNDAKKDHLPSIEHWRMSFTMPADKIAVTEKHKLRLTSKDNLTNFDQDGTDVITGILGKRWVAFWAKPKESSPSGWDGWVLKFSPDNEDDFVKFSTYEAQNDVAYTGIPSNQTTQVINGVGYVSIDRQAPVITTEETDSLVLIQLTAAETETDLPKVKTVTPGTLASGFSLCADATPADTQILQIASGTYSLTQVTFAAAAAVGDGVYVDESGKLTLTESDYQCGWVVEDGVVIDVDLYNNQITGGGTDDNPIFKTVSIDTNGSGQSNFTATLNQDGELHTVLDATREFRVNHKDVGTGLTTTVMGVDNTQAQFLVPIMQGNDAVALAKDIPEIPSLSGYVEKYKRADLDYVRMTYQGKYGDDANYYPVSINQDGNGWTFFKFTGNMVFECRDKDSGDSLSRPLEVGETRSTFNVPAYIGDNKIVAEHTSPVFSKLQTQRTTRPDFPPVSIYVDDYHNTIMEVNAEFKLRHVDADGNTTQTVQTSVDRWNFLVQPKFDGKNLLSEGADTSFEKVLISGTRRENAYNNFSIRGSTEGGDSGDGLILKTYLRSDGSASPDYIQYFGQTKGNNQLANTESVADAIAEDKAKGIWIGGVIKDTLNDDGHSGDQFDCGDPKHWVEFRKTGFEGSHFKVRQSSSVTSSEIVIHLHPESGMASCPFRVQTGAGQYRDKTIRVNEKWRFFLMQGVYPYFEKIDDGMASGGVSSDFDGEGFGVPVWSDAGAGTIVQRQITGNYRNTSGELGDLIINLRTDNGVKNFRFYYSLPWNTLDSGRKVYAKVDEKAGQNKIIRPGEMWQCEVKAGQVFDSFFWTKINDGTNSFVLEEDFNAKSGYNRLVSGGGSTHTITYSENGSILKISNPTVKVQLLQGMSADTPHGYIKYINSHNADVVFEWYDRNGNQVINNVPSVCPADTVVEIFADYAKDEYVLSFGQSKVINTMSEEDQLMEGLASGVIYAKDVTVG